MQRPDKEVSNMKVKHVVSGFLLFCLLPSGVFGQVTELTLDRIPDSMDEFLFLRDEIADSPEGGAAVYVAALIMFTRDEDVGTDALTVALDRSMIKSDPEGYKGYSPVWSFADKLQRYLRPKPYIARSYIAGTSPGGAYELPEPPYTVVLSRNKYSVIAEDEVKVFVSSSGADSPRPVTLLRNNRGIWKVKVESLILGIRPPEETVDDAL
jgi:hypothetical protein